MWDLFTPLAPIHSAPEVMFAWLAMALPDKGASIKQGGGGRAGRGWEKYLP